jgi:hypothetical protein
MIGTVPEDVHPLYSDRYTNGRFRPGHKKLGGRRPSGRPRNAMRSLTRMLTRLTTKRTPSPFRRRANQRSVRVWLRSFNQPAVGL